jgi:hypothetical protein
VTTQPEALRLADSIEGLQWDSIASSWNDLEPAATELRRLHSVNAELLEALRWIATVNAMDYEYQKCARAAIAKAEEVKP